jgi:hypothetical protein
VVGGNWRRGKFARRKEELKRKNIWKSEKGFYFQARGFGS